MVFRFREGQVLFEFTILGKKYIEVKKKASFD